MAVSHNYYFFKNHARDEGKKNKIMPEMPRNLFGSVNPQPKFLLIGIAWCEEKYLILYSSKESIFYTWQMVFFSFGRVGMAYDEENHSTHIIEVMLASLSIQLFLWPW